MAEFNSLTIQSGVTRQIHNPDVLIVGAGVDTDVATVLTIGGSNATSVSLAKNTTISGSNTFSTGTGTVTVNGATVFTSVAVTASGATSFDLSGGSGAFKTSAGAVTVGPGTITVSGTTTFTASGTAVTINNNATVTGVATATGGVITHTIDTASAVALVLGGTTASTVQIGKSGSLTEVLGNFKVDGTETIIGTSTFLNPVTFDGNVTVADGYTLSVVGATGGGFTLDGYSVASIISNDATTPLTINSVTTSGSSYSAGVGVLLQNQGVTGLAVQQGASGGTVNLWIPSGAVLQATGSGQIIATSSAGGSTLVIAGLTTTGVTSGLAGYISANSTVSLTDNATLTTSYFFGVNTGISGSMSVNGPATFDFTTVGGSPSPGAPVYLAAAADDTSTGAGKLTATPPSTSGSVVAKVGICLDNTNYTGSKTSVVLIQATSPVIL